MLLNVQKMTCNHCVRSVTAAVHTVAPEAQVEVDLPRGTVRVSGSDDETAIAAAIRDEGYSVEVLER